MAERTRRIRDGASLLRGSWIDAKPLSPGSTLTATNVFTGGRLSHQEYWRER